MERIESLATIKDIELNILKQVHVFCEKHGLKYVLAYGTLIGAVRHNGFIPWDDDIDIWMPRKDYDIFEELFPIWGKQRHLYIAGPHSSEHYLPRHMLKVCDDRTVLIESTHEKYNEIGLFIDIFPLDNVPQNLAFAKAWTRYIRTYKYRSLASTISTDSSAYKDFNIIKKSVTQVLKHGNTRRIVDGFVKSSAYYKNSSTDNVTALYANDPFIFNINDFFPAFLHDFENDSFFIPGQYDKLLRIIYGDYQQVPPEEERIPTHTSEVYLYKG